jgi:hypothetical protein
MQGRQRLTPVHPPLHSAGRSTNAVQQSVRAGLLLLMMSSSALRSAALRRSTRGYAGLLGNDHCLCLHDCVPVAERQWLNASVER